MTSDHSAGEESTHDKSDLSSDEETSPKNNKKNKSDSDKEVENKSDSGEESTRRKKKPQQASNKSESDKSDTRKDKNKKDSDKEVANEENKSDSDSNVKPVKKTNNKKKDRKLKKEKKEMKKNKKIEQEEKDMYTDESDEDKKIKNPKKKLTKIDRLKEDPVIDSQLFFCVSFLTPEGVRNCKIRAFKVRGSYARRSDADRRAKKLRKIDPYFHIFVGEVGKWLEFDPDPKNIKEHDYVEKELNDMMKARMEQYDKTKKLHEQRVKDSSDFVNDGGRIKKVKDHLREKLKNREVGGEDITADDPTRKKKKKSSKTDTNISEKSNKSATSKNFPKPKHTAGGLDEKAIKKHEEKIKKEQQANLSQHKKVQEKISEQTKVEKEMAEIKAMMRQLESS